MPVRNEAGFIPRSLSSVLEQDYPADRLEVLIVDGDSDDGTAYAVAEVIEQARAGGRTVCATRILVNPGRIVPSSLNLGLEVAKGDVIVRVDGHCGDRVRLHLAVRRRTGPLWSVVRRWSDADLG